MAPERYRRAKELFLELCDLAEPARRCALDSACGGDVELRAAVLGMLACDQADDALSEDAIRAGRAVLEHALIGASGSTPAPTAGPAPQQVGRYRLLRQIGEGGMGAVFEAEQESPRRTVALKLIRPGLSSAEILARFQRESEVLARLQHPGIAHVYEAGVGDVVSLDGNVSRQPFFAMELVRGRPLLDFARDRGLPERERLALLALVADAVHHAHQKGVIHRDLKPANLLVQEEGADVRGDESTKTDAAPHATDSSLRAVIPASLRGFPKILDFGVARLADADQPLTMHTNLGQIVGTLPYMSPEQVAGDSRQIDTRSDVYALGVIMCELLSGALPYELTGKPLVEAARIIREAEPARLGALVRRLNHAARIDRDLETIAAKALQKEKERRYASAAEFAADIRRYLRNEPVIARPATTFYQLRKFAARNRVLVGGSIATLLALVIGLVGIAIFATREARQRRYAEQNANVAQQAQARAEQVAYRAALGAAQAELSRGRLPAAERHLEDAALTLRGWEWRHLRWRCSPDVRSFGGPEPVADAAITADDRRLIIVTKDADARVYDFETGVLEGAFALFSTPASPNAPGRRAVIVLSLGSRADRLVCTRFVYQLDTGGSSEFEACAWGLDPPTRLWERRNLDAISSVTLSADATEVEVPEASSFSILDTLTGTFKRRIPLTPRARLAPQLAGPDRDFVVFGPGQGTSIERVDTGATVWTSGSQVFRLSRDRLAVTSIEPRGLVMTDVRSGAVVREARAGPAEGRVQGVFGVSDDLRCCLIASESSALLRRLDTPTLLPGFSVPASGNDVVRLSPSGRYVVSVSPSRPIRVYSTWMADPPFVVRAVRGASVGAISADGRLTLSSNWGFATLCETEHGEERWTRYDGLPWTGAPAFAPDASQIACYSWSAFAPAVLLVLSSDDGRTIHSNPWPHGHIGTLLWSRDGGTLIAGTHAGELLRVTPDTATIVARAQASTTAVGAASLAPDGLTLAVSTAASEVGQAAPVVLFDAVSLEPRGTLPAPSARVTALAFSADGRRLAGGTEDGALILWDLEPRRVRFDVRLGEHSISQLCWIDAENRVVAGDTGGRLLVAAAADGALYATLAPELGSVWGLCYDAAQDRLVANTSAAPAAIFETASAGDVLEDRSVNAAARSLVNPAFVELTFAEDVAAQIAAMPDLATRVRTAALALTKRRGEHPRWLNSDALSVSRSELLAPDGYELALRKSERAYAILPGRHDMLVTQATLLYRLGRDAEALAKLAAARRLAAEAPAPAADDMAQSPQAWAVTALIQHRAGRNAEAHAALDMAVDALKARGGDADHWDRRFVSDAIAALQEARDLTPP